MFLRMKSEMKMPWYRDREWKVKWKWLKIEIENENASRSRSEISREFSRNSWEPDSMQNRLTFLHHVFSNVPSNCFPKMMQSYMGCICLTFSIVYFQMFPQMACQRVCIFTLIASNISNIYVWFFSTVYFQMSPQIVWVMACNRTWAAIVLLSTVPIQMLLQTTRCVLFRCLFKVPVSEDGFSH